ncbi:MAG: sigma 54-interacting transcriptional regulator [Deltaproteobacteria bacterium]|nr:sigma 54-interacting transcriptional regulator [Deltaproteobacteria bacterium]
MGQRLYHEGEGDGDEARAMAEALRRVCGVEVGEEQAAEIVRRFREGRGAPARRSPPGGEGGSGRAVERSGPFDELRAPSAGEVDGIVGSSAAIREMLRRLERIARADATVLILGENGTGKELAARAVHRRSRRAGGAFISQNCSAMPETLLDSTLFGHVRGAFTGAVTDRMGLFEAASGGTLFLDEVGEMSASLQAKLLRVLEEGQLAPVGAVEPRRVDVRVVAATNRDLEEMARGRAFREDLLHRLSVLVLRVPPLRERREDIPLLVEHFRSRLVEREGRERGFTRECMERLGEYGWPGNVRELRHEVERLWVFSGEELEIGPEHLSPEIARAAQPKQAGKAGLHANVEALERRQIEDALRRTKGNRTHAATLLGVSRRNLIRKIAKMGLGGR